MFTEFFSAIIIEAQKLRIEPKIQNLEKIVQVDTIKISNKDFYDQISILRDKLKKLIQTKKLDSLTNQTASSILEIINSTRLRYIKKPNSKTLQTSFANQINKLPNQPTVNYLMNLEINPNF